MDEGGDGAPAVTAPNMFCRVRVSGRGWSSRLRPVDLSPQTVLMRRFSVSVVLLAAMVVGGTAGFYLLSDRKSLFEDLYLTVLILTTVGMKEEGLRLTHSQQVWAMILMLTGISTALYATSNLVAFMVEGEMGRLFGRRHVQKQLHRLSGHYVVCGFGRMGRALCEALRAKDVPFVLIEHDAAKTAEAEQLGYLYLTGDALEEQTLEQARLDTAKGLASCLRSDADNVFVTLTARALRDELTIIARAERPDTESKLRRAGADRVIVPPVIGAKKVMQMLLHPAVEELVDLAVGGADLDISSVKLAELPGAVGRQLKDLSLPQQAGLMVVAILRPDGNREFNPNADTVLKLEDQIIVIGPSAGVEKILTLFGTGMRAA